MVLINNIFEEITIRKMILLYICASILCLVVLEIPFVNSIYLKDKSFGDVILNSSFLIFFYIMLSHKNVHIKSKLINSINKIDYKKIFHLYALNVGIYIGTGLCIFIGNKIEIKVPSTMYIIFGITLAPIVEELIFRGVILNRLKIKFRIIPAIFISSIVFGIVHFDINILGRLIFGVLCAILFLQTKNILNCMILHLINNASVLIFPIISQYTNFSINPNGEFQTVILVLITFSCFLSSLVFSIIYIKNNLPRKNNMTI